MLYTRIRSNWIAHKVNHSTAKYNTYYYCNGSTCVQNISVNQDRCYQNQCVNNLKRGSKSRNKLVSKSMKIF